jgi:hypothetical protein
MKISRLSPFYLFFLSLGANAQSTNTSQDLPTVEVMGKAEHLIGKASTSSQGQTSAAELAERPFLRRGELLESVPGVIITQHSGDGKANQYFVRGFNLDHGTDFSIFMDGQPVNFITHAHGQGYADLNPIIPELVESLDYWKGPFFAELGDLSTAGAAKFRFFDMLPGGIASITIGEDNFFRGLIADTIDLSTSDGVNGGLTARSGLTYALEYNYYDGPWQMKSDSERANGFLKYFRDAGQDKFSLTAMAYTGDWNSTDQIPKRAIDSGDLNRFGNVDPTLGGNSNRYSLMAAWDREHSNGRTHVDAYAGYYDLDLFSNFTYVLGGGDQFEQKDERWFVGGSVRREWDFAEKNRLVVGVQTRNDFLNDIGLYNTTARDRNGVIREDDVSVNTFGIFSSLDYHVNSWFRVQPGIRADYFHFDVDGNNNPVDSGSDSDAIVSPKLNLVFGPWNETELYISGGYGFHSNDARGVNLGVDGVDPLVRTYGGEIGVRTEVIEGLVNTLSFFYLHSDSELLYVGDAGTSEAGPATERIGVEWSTYWRPTEWLMVDNEMTLSEGKLKGVGGDDKIPGAVPFVWSTGITVGQKEGFFGTLRSRYFSPRPLIEDASQESGASLQINTRIGYRKNDWEVSLDCLNVLDRKDNDIEYFYESLMPGEGAGTGPNGGHEDIHLHPSEPRTFRVTFTKKF